jgi:hypothetical protein
MADIPILGRRVVTCRGCGCNDNHACVDVESGAPCCWVLLDVEITPRGVEPLASGVCSACAADLDWHPALMLQIGTDMAFNNPRPSTAETIEGLFGRE